MEEEEEEEDDAGRGETLEREREEGRKGRKEPSVN